VYMLRDQRESGGNIGMQDSRTDPKKPGIRDNTSDAGHSQEKQLWHTPVLQRLDTDLTASGANKVMQKMDSNHNRS
jgi:hypothetical protein